MNASDASRDMTQQAYTCFPLYKLLLMIMMIMMIDFQDLSCISVQIVWQSNQFCDTILSTAGTLIDRVILVTLASNWHMLMCISFLSVSDVSTQKRSKRSAFSLKRKTGELFVSVCGRSSILQNLLRVTRHCAAFSLSRQTPWTNNVWKV